MISHNNSQFIIYKFLIGEDYIEQYNYPYPLQEITHKIKESITNSAKIQLFIGQNCFKMSFLCIYKVAFVQNKLMRLLFMQLKLLQYYIGCCLYNLFTHTYIMTDHKTSPRIPLKLMKKREVISPFKICFNSTVLTSLQSRELN